jgi:hypothetical protein
MNSSISVEALDFLRCYEKLFAQVRSGEALSDFHDLPSRIEQEIIPE